MKNITIKFTRTQALAMDLLVCSCGHRQNNHFDLNPMSCAHCGCMKYNEKIRIGKLVKKGKKK